MKKRIIGENKMKPAIKLMRIILILFLVISCENDVNQPKVVDTTPPSIPGNFSVVINETSDGVVTLEWTLSPESDVLAYVISRKLSSSADWTVIDSLGSGIRQYKDEYLEYDLTYYYAIQATDRAGNISAYSSTVEAYPRNENSPSKPYGLKVNAHHQLILGGGEQVDVQISWSPNTDSDIDRYAIYRSTNQSFAAVDSNKIFTTEVTSYSDNDVEAGTRYYYRIRAIDRADWESDPSVTVSDIPLEMPVLISPIDNEQVTTSIPAFIWQKLDEATAYQISVRTSQLTGEIWTANIEQSNTENISITYPANATTPLLSGQTYYWMIGTFSIPEYQEVNSYSAMGVFRTP
jgi:fibronectin type 3 domain-containing protein